MIPDLIPSFVLNTLFVLAALFVVSVGVGFFAIFVLYIVDVTQTRHSIRRNYPVIGRLRYWLERLGILLRQYFFAMDREEMPFNREQRGWVYRAAKNLDNTVGFGSTRNLNAPGTIIFVNTAFPSLAEDTSASTPMTIGPFAREPYESRRFFNISAMSYGAISKPAVLALSNGACKAGCWLNTGEGGVSPWHLEGGADLMFQIGTAKYGVRKNNPMLDDEALKQVAALKQVRMFEIKLSQGAKPGKGGILPAIKVTPEIARIRGIPAGQESISPNRHPEISNVAELLDFVDRVRGITGKPTGFKAVFSDGDWLHDLCREITARGAEHAPDFITVDGGDGGSGAAPMSLIDCVGLTLHESLPLVVDILAEHGLRERIKVIASGKLISPWEVGWALCAGADFVTSARGFMFALGCIQALQCNKNTCPTGVTTHNPRLQRGLDPIDKAERVFYYVANMEHEVGTIAYSCGAAEPRALRRNHCRITLADGRSTGLNMLYPPS
jgi:glutamate synthase domain-containing protein 2